MSRFFRVMCVVGVLVGPVFAQPAPDEIPAIIAQRRSELADIVVRFEADRWALDRRYPVRVSPARLERFKAFYAGWDASLDAVVFDTLSLPGKVDWVLLRNLVRHEIRLIENGRLQQAPLEPSVPFMKPVLTLTENIGRPGPVSSSVAAVTLSEIKALSEGAQKSFDDKLKDVATKLTPTDSKQLLELIDALRWSLGQWFAFYNGYDPSFSWWCDAPFRAADKALDDYAKVVREKGVGITAENPNVIVGVPIGRDALLSELQYEMIPYTPEELIAIAEREFAWCEAEMKKAAGEMGLGDDRMKALERVKQAYVEPGQQPALINALAEDAIAYLKKNDLITVPPMAEESWRLEMLSPDRQLIAPFFLGGESIQVAFPTSGMKHEDKMMSLRGNNRHFAHATVFHELIPGHHLQQFSQARSNTHRSPFGTAFWTEGWALYWEMTMWDLGYHATPEDRVGALFWRSHRCARIICSLKYHLGEMSAQQWVDFLVERVGHEKANAEGEVRRSVAGGYGPLYQVGYMIGGLQFRALHKEVVGGVGANNGQGLQGGMTSRAFHDAVMRENTMPVEMVRALITGKAPTKDGGTVWRFDGP